MRSRINTCGSTASGGDKLDRSLEKIMYSAGVILVIAITLGGWMLTTAKDFAARGWIIFLRVSFRTCFLLLRSLPVTGKSALCILKLLRAQQHRLTGLKCAQIKFAQGFHFHGDFVCLVEIRARRDHAVIRQQTCLAPAQREQRIIGQALCAEGGIVRAAYAVAAHQRDHVVEWRDVFSEASQRGRRDAMGMDDCAEFRALHEYVAMERPLAGRLPASA